MGQFGYSIVPNIIEYNPQSTRTIPSNFWIATYTEIYKKTTGYSLRNIYKTGNDWTNTDINSRSWKS